jgi:ATP-dependent Lon protease
MSITFSRVRLSIRCRKFNVPILVHSDPILPGLVRTLPHSTGTFQNTTVSLLENESSSLGVLSSVTKNPETKELRVVPKFRIEKINENLWQTLPATTILTPDRSARDVKLVKQDLIIASAKLNASFQTSWSEVSGKYKLDADPSLFFDLYATLLKVSGNYPINLTEILHETCLFRRGKKVADFVRSLDLLTQPTASYPPEIQKLIDSEKSRIRPESPQESALTENFLKVIQALPWNKPPLPLPSLQEFKNTLESKHGRFDKIKQRFYEIFASMKYAEIYKLPAPKIKPLLLLGYPGVGKSSFAEAVASALNRPLIRISLGGITDGSEIRGHRKAYIGAKPGQIIEGYLRCQESSVVILLDEIDKLETSTANNYTTLNSSNVSSALLEVLDDRRSLRDLYIDTDFDLSNSLIIATANSDQTIPRPLLNRMEIIEIPAYTTSEKTEIAEKLLVHRACEEVRVPGFAIPPSLIRQIIDKYTREAGLRELYGCLLQLAQQRAYHFVNGEITSQELSLPLESHIAQALGLPKYKKFTLDDFPRDEIGVAYSLGWTELGGEILRVEARQNEEPGILGITGNCSDIFKESCLTVYNSLSQIYDVKGVNLHISDFSMRKEGSSAGLAVASAMLSAVLNQTLAAPTAFTGEVSLTGRVTGVQGIREKLLAASDAGFKMAILSDENEPDWENCRHEIPEDFKVAFVSNISQCFDLIFSSS